MGVYIQGVSGITIQDTFKKSMEQLEPTSFALTYNRCIDPVFKEYLDPNSARRMSKIVKRAILTAKQALADAGMVMPDAIISGTGLGCVEDTEKFLDAMVNKGEYCLQPTNFIQSTHNTIGSQIAILLGCNGYNNTHVQKGVSFESALMDSTLLLRQRKVHSVLVGGYDEMTPTYFKLLKRIGYWRDEVDDTLQIIKHRDKGSFAGEGSVSLLLSDNKNDNTYCEIVANELSYGAMSKSMVESFAERCGYSMDSIDVVAMGMNGDSSNDEVYWTLIKELQIDEKVSFYKPICGEYYTATGFALLYYAEILKWSMVPAYATLSGKKVDSAQTVLLYNHSNNKQHSLTLLKK